MSLKNCIDGIHRTGKPRMPMISQEKRALIIGINYAGTDSQLSGCINDANKMKWYLLNKCGFKESDITMLTDHITAKPEELPTRANIIKNINALVRDLPKRKTCQLVFHYSGHGSYTMDKSNDEKDRKDETICPLDYDRYGDITDDDLKSMLVDPVPANAKLFCLMDCCHSGTGLDLRYECRVYRTGRKTDYKLLQDKKLSQSTGEVILFSGCKDEQYSADAYIKGKYQGAMTWGFFEVLDKYDYRPIPYKKLIKEIQALLRKNKYEQIPQLSTGKYVDLKSTFCLTD